MTEKPRTVLPLSDAVRSSGVELDRLREQCLRVEDELLLFLKESEVQISRERSQVFQDLDLLAQSLDGLSRFLSELGSAVPRETEADIGPALETLDLRDMFDRLLRVGTGKDVMTIEKQTCEPILFF